MAHPETSLNDRPNNDGLTANPKEPMLGKRWILFGLVGVFVIVVGVQQIFTAQARGRRLVERHEYFEHLEAQSKIARKKLIEQGRLWIGQLHEADGGNETTTTTSVTPDMTEARRILLDETLLDGSSKYVVSLELHECTPGSPDCTSGGSLSVRTRAGVPLLNCAVDFLGHGQAGQGHYDLTWSESVWAESDAEKLSLLQELGGESDPLNRHGFLKEMQVAYGYEQTREPKDNDDEHAVRILRAILRSVVADR